MFRFVRSLSLRASVEVPERKLFIVRSENEGTKRDVHQVFSHRLSEKIHHAHNLQRKGLRRRGIGHHSYGGDGGRVRTLQR
jgi:hypothetical protein